MHTIGVLSNGVHKTFTHILSAIDNGRLPHTTIRAVVSTTKEGPILDVARLARIPALYVVDSTNFEPAILNFFKAQKVQTVILIGYTRKIGQTLLDAYPHRILNIHGAPLPEYGGKNMIQARTQKAVLESGATMSGPTIHIVTEQYDEGRVLGHWPVHVRPEDTPQTLNDRCNLAGRELYVSLLRDFEYRIQHPEIFS